MEPVTWRRVESSNIALVGWNADGMFVSFHNDSTYFYRGVSRQRAVAMSRAKSVGVYFARKIRPVFAAERMR